MKYSILLTFIIVLIIGCSKEDGTTLAYRDIHKYLPLQADSASILLNKLSKRLPPKERKSRDLLKLYIEDLKNWNYQDDSLAFRIVLNDYNYANKLEQAIHLYYKGAYFMQQQKYGQALESFHQAEILAQQQENNHLLGMIYMKSAEIFYEKVLYNTAIKYAGQSHDHFIKSGDELRANRSLGMKLFSKLELKDQEEAQELYTTIKNYCIKHNDLVFFQYLANEIMYILLSYDKVYEAGLIDKDLKKITSKGTTTPMQWIYKINQNIEQKKIQEAWNTLLAADSIITLPYERATLYQAYINYYKAIGDYQSAFDAMENHINIYDSLFNIKQRLSLVRLESRAQNFELEYNLKKSVILRQRLVYFSILTFLLSAIIIVTYRRKNRKQKEELDNRLAILSTLKESNQSLLSKLNVHQEKEKQLKEQIESKLDYARTLADLYSKFPDKPGTILKRMNETMALAPANKEFTTTIINSVNLYYNNAIDHLVKAHPELIHSEILFSSLIIGGFSMNEMTLILNCNSVDAVYTRKYRLKQKLRLSKDIDVEDYLATFAKEQV